MPELPEVQTFVDAIQENYSGNTIDGIAFHRNNLRYPLDKNKLKLIFSKNAILQKCFRVGKQLVLQTNNGSALVSLGMTGSFHESNGISPEKHEHITLFFNKKSPLAYSDPRRFGSWTVYDEGKIFKAVDPLDSLALRQFFGSSKFSQSYRSVKDVLMDQKCIGGLGNIYALEALFKAKIHPFTSCHKVTKKEKEELSHFIPLILNKAIELKGSSVKSYRTLEGESGLFQQQHLVYDRQGKICSTPDCKGIILRIAQGGRSSWYCPKCQPER